MFTEINDIKIAKKILNMEYDINIKKCQFKQDKEYIIAKKKHSYDCLKILKIAYSNKSLKYGISVLLHDIGRFSEYKLLKNFKHEEYGYYYLREKYTSNPLILLPIKYHEKDIGWLEELQHEKEYMKSSAKIQDEIFDCTMILKDIDIISNMKFIYKGKTKKVDDINNVLIEKLKNGILGEKTDVQNNYDEIVYILCGLTLISQESSWNYLKKYKIVEKLIKKLYKMINSKNNIIITKEVEDFVYKKFPLKR